MEINERIKQRRKQLGLSAEQVAERIGVSPATIYRYESQHIKNMRAEKLKPIADALYTTPAYLMGWSDSVSDIPPGFEPLPRMVRIPLVGRIACGDPITAEENLEGYVEAPEEIRCDFALRCKGDSMIDAGIEDGDLVYIRCQPEVENGDIAAVRIGDEATLKRIYFDGTQLTIMPCNPRYTPKTFTGEELEDIHIEGKAVGYTHWLE